MNIFYYSVHQILEDDEIRLFQNLGHNVFCIGANRRGTASQGFRPPIQFSKAECDLFDLYESLGGKYAEGATLDEVVPPDFVNHIDAVVVMHDIAFIERHWAKLKRSMVIWRTIGQGVDAYEVRLKPLRDEGLKIVRYSPVEESIPDSLGQEATIRFYKDPAVYGTWSGTAPQVLTFSNMFAARYPREAADYLDIVDGFKAVLGGIGNETISPSIGFVDFEEQKKLYQASRCYLYSTGLNIPYTLNFIEAWMTGTPIVVYAPPAQVDKYFEIDKLVDDGRTGYICRSVEEAKTRLSMLMNDSNLAADISAAARAAAIATFGPSHISRQWDSVLQRNVNQVG